MSVKVHFRTGNPEVKEKLGHKSKFILTRISVKSASAVWPR